MLEIRNVTKRFGGVTAIDRIDLVIEPMRTHVLLGSSGSGKSTLLRTILGITSIDEGEILVAGIPVSTMPNLVRSRRIGYVPQDGGLFPHLTAKANIAIVARAAGWNEARIGERIAELIPLVALDPELLNRFPRELSGGQSQRVSMLRAVFLDPEILVLDEPLGALDPLIRSDLQNELKEVFRKLKKTVVFVTHDLGEAAFLGDQIVLMHEGRIVQCGRLEDLMSAPASPFVSRFLSAQRILVRSGH